MESKYGKYPVAGVSSAPSPRRSIGMIDLGKKDAIARGTHWCHALFLSFFSCWLGTNLDLRFFFDSTLLYLNVVKVANFFKPFFFMEVFISKIFSSEFLWRSFSPLNNRTGYISIGSLENFV